MADLFKRSRQWVHRRQRARELDSVRIRLSQRGINADALSDDELDSLIHDGRHAMERVNLHAGDTTGAFVALVRKWEKI